jgi:hypothetical protein
MLDHPSYAVKLRMQPESAGSQLPSPQTLCYLEGDESPRPEGRYMSLLRMRIFWREEFAGLAGKS